MTLSIEDFLKKNATESFSDYMGGGNGGSHYSSETAELIYGVKDIRKQMSEAIDECHREYYDMKADGRIDEWIAKWKG